MKIYNTLTKKIERFETIKPEFVGMYTCGPTVYDHTHLGHMRTYVNTDLLRRVFEYGGYQVKQVMNITDVGHLFGDRDMGEDKLEAAAKKERKSAWEIAKMYEKEFFDTLDALNVKRPSVVCHATEHIAEMIGLIQRIENSGFAYRTSDGIYFETSKIKDYNRLSGMPIDKLKEGARVEPNPEKKNPIDFALWKFSPKDVQRQMEWDSPWGVGFPGWHIECSAMGMKYLGERFDVHTGGEDHIPIHHTNERAQNIAATSHPVVRFWFHNAFLLVEGQKMSKSLGNFYWLKDIKRCGFDPLALRYLFLTAHYRSKMNFTWEGLRSAQRAYKKLVELVRMWQQEEQSEVLSESGKSVDNFREMFQEKINNDLNAPEALAVVWQVVKSNIPDLDKLNLILKSDQVLGLNLSEVGERPIPFEVRNLVEERGKLRKQKKWQEADGIRKRVEGLGWKIEDAEESAKLRPTL